MNEVQIFQSPEFGEVRTVTIDHEPWFVAADVCKALDIGDTHVAIRRLDEDEKGRCSIPTPGGLQSLSAVSEAGLYSLVLASRKPEARRFRRWIVHEVIPAIRRHGMYATEDLLSDPDLAIRAFTALKEEREKRRALEEENARMRPKEIFADAVSASQTSILIGDLAKLISQNGIQIGQKRLFEWMRSNGYLMSVGTSRNMPTQRSMGLGLLEVKESNIQNPDGSIRITRTTKVTGKGQLYFINRFLGKEGKDEA